MIYSFYCNETKETLEHHTQLALSLIKDKSKLIKYGNKLSKNFITYAKLSVIFHDLGKVFYQKNFSRQTKLSNFLSFHGHEFLSAYIFEKVRKKLLEIDPYNAEKYNEYKIITFAILYHHHAMGRDLNERYIRMDSLKLGFNYFNELEDIVSNLLIKAGVNEFKPEVLSDVLAGMKYSDNFLGNVKAYIRVVKEDLWREFVDDANFRKKSLLLLMLLISVDYLAAQRVRRPTSTIFSRAINDFYQLYILK